MQGKEKRRGEYKYETRSNIDIWKCKRIDAARDRQRRRCGILRGVSGVGLSENGYGMLIQPGELHCLHQAFRPALALKTPHHLIKNHHCCDFSCHALRIRKEEERRTIK